VIKREVKSFGHAFRGLKFLFQSQKHFRFHVVALILVISLGAYFAVTWVEWTILLLCSGTVLMAEALNSALEIALDHLHPEIHPAIGKAKDMAAAGVLIVSGLSAVIGLLIFWPYLELF
jgi:diacylglycerol kinase